MTFEDFKKLDYPDIMEMEDVLSDLLYKGQLGVNTVLYSYTTAIERERHKLNAQFNEATTVLAMGLSGNWRGDDKKELQKRAVHIFNLNKTFPANVYNEKYGYTEKDKERFDQFTELHYGEDFNDR